MAETEQEQTLNKWLEGRPEVIVNMAKKLKPWKRYRVKPTGEHCSLYSYSENGTVTVVVNGHDIDFMARIYAMLPVIVFGMSPDNLEELE